MLLKLQNLNRKVLHHQLITSEQCFSTSGHKAISGGPRNVLNLELVHFLLVHWLHLRLISLAQTKRVEFTNFFFQFILQNINLFYNLVFHYLKNSNRTSGSVKSMLHCCKLTQATNATGIWSVIHCSKFEKKPISMFV